MLWDPINSGELFEDVRVEWSMKQETLREWMGNKRFIDAAAGFRSIVGDVACKPRNPNPLTPRSTILYQTILSKLDVTGSQPRLQIPS
jgi:hypothetical protein